MNVQGGTKDLKMSIPNPGEKEYWLKALKEHIKYSNPQTM
jgi:hypothetical protein